MPEPNSVCISWHLIYVSGVLHKSLPSVCVYVYIPSFARQWLNKHVPAATSTRNNSKIVGRFVFYAVRVFNLRGPFLGITQFELPERQLHRLA
jgi:hypothetical protein